MDLRLARTYIPGFACLAKGLVLIFILSRPWVFMNIQFHVGLCILLYFNRIMRHEEIFDSNAMLFCIVIAHAINMYRFTHPLAQSTLEHAAVSSLLLMGGNGNSNNNNVPSIHHQIHHHHHHRHSGALMMGKRSKEDDTAMIRKMEEKAFAGIIRLEVQQQRIGAFQLLYCTVSLALVAGWDVFTWSMHHGNNTIRRILYHHHRQRQRPAAPAAVSNSVTSVPTIRILAATLYAILVVLVIFDPIIVLSPEHHETENVFLHHGENVTSSSINAADKPNDDASSSSSPSFVARSSSIPTVFLFLVRSISFLLMCTTWSYVYGVAGMVHVLRNTIRLPLTIPEQLGNSGDAYYSSSTTATATAIASNTKGNRNQKFNCRTYMVQSFVPCQLRFMCILLADGWILYSTIACMALVMMRQCMVLFANSGDGADNNNNNNDRNNKSVAIIPSTRYSSSLSSTATTVNTADAVTPHPEYFVGGRHNNKYGISQDDGDGCNHHPWIPEGGFVSSHYIYHQHAMETPDGVGGMNIKPQQASFAETSYERNAVRNHDDDDGGGGDDDNDAHSPHALSSSFEQAPSAMHDDIPPHYYHHQRPESFPLISLENDNDTGIHHHHHQHRHHPYHEPDPPSLLPSSSNGRDSFHLSKRENARVSVASPDAAAASQLSSTTTSIGVSSTIPATNEQPRQQQQQQYKKDDDVNAQVPPPVQDNNVDDEDMRLFQMAQQHNCSHNEK